MPANLLPNSSFELDFSQQIRTPRAERKVQTNWGDLQNRLTLKATALGQVPETPPQSAAVEDAVDGARVGAIPLEAVPGGAEGHLTSPVVEVVPCQVYTLSVYARSGEPSARLNLGVWTRPLDFEATPDMLGWSLPLTGEWQRHSTVFIPQDLETRAVVDLAARADRPCTVEVDAVQLEEGPAATAYRTRFPVEAKIEGRQPRALIHLQDEPLKRFYLTTFNSSGRPLDFPLKVQFFDLLGGEEVLTRAVDGPVPAGRREAVLDIDFPLVGEFIARVAAADGTPVGIDEYLFVVHPVIGDDFQWVLRSRRGEVEQLPAGRAWLPWQNEVNWYSECRNNIVVTDGGVVHVMTSDDKTVMLSADGGRSWSALEVSRPVDTVLRDGSFLNSEPEPSRLVVSRSADDGQNWEAVGSVEMPPGTRGLQIGPVTELRDGGLVWPIGRPADTITPHSVVHCYRSEDGGRTWNRGVPMTHGGEPAISELSDGRLIAVCRNNPSAPADGWERVFDNEKPWQLWQRALGAATLGSYVKRTTLVESEDRGDTWIRPRPGTFLLDQIRGHVIELPDGRLVLFNTHRVPTLRGGERARVSSDGGRTWEEEIYYMNAAKAYPGYATSCVLPPHLGDGEPGMILTVVGERSESNWGSEGPPTSEGFEHMPRMIAVRWRP